MGRADRIAVAPFGNHRLQQAVEVLPMAGNRIFGKNTNVAQVPIAIERGHLRVSDRHRVGIRGRLETQISLHSTKLVVGWCRLVSGSGGASHA